MFSTLVTQNTKRTEMKEFESYFESLNFHFTNWNDILESENIDIHGNSCEKTEQNVQLLPRKDVSLYGIIPKLERRSFSSCKECKHIFNPRDVLSHKNCSFKVKSQHVSHFKKKVKTKKKPPVPPPQVQEHKSRSLDDNSVSQNNSQEISVSIVGVSESPTLGHLQVNESTNEEVKSLNTDEINFATTTVSVSNENDSFTSPVLTTMFQFNEFFSQEGKSLSKDDGYFSQNYSQDMPSKAMPVGYGVLSPISTSLPLDVQEHKSLSLEENSVSQNNSQEISVSIVGVSESPTLGNLPVNESTSEEVKNLNAEENNFATTTTVSVSNEKDLFGIPILTTMFQFNEFFNQEGKSLSKDDGYFSQNYSQDMPSDAMPVGYGVLSPISTSLPLDVNESTNEEVKRLNAEEINFWEATTTTVSISNEKHSFTSPMLTTIFQDMPSEAMLFGYGVLSPISTSLPLDIFDESHFKRSPLDILSEMQISRELCITIPEQLNVKMYKSRPRLTSCTFYGTKKIGGAIVTKRNFINQRKDIMDAINAMHHNHTNNYRSISFDNNANKKLTNSVNDNKYVVKKINSDKHCMTNNDVKNVHSSSEMNGFIDLTDENNEQQQEIDETYSYLNNNNNDRKQQPPNNSHSCVLS